MPICTLPSGLTICSFYDKKDTPFYGLANYSHDAVSIFDPLLNKLIRWPTTEHFFQAQKIINSAQRQKFVNDMQNKGPNDCRTQVNHYLPHHPMWHQNQIKQNVMLLALRAKYDQCPRIKALINSTGNMPIVEDTAAAPYEDNEWGCGYRGNGANWLGVLWMQVRAEKRDGLSERAARAQAFQLNTQSVTALVALGTRRGLLQNDRRITSTGLSIAKRSKEAPVKTKDNGNFINCANQLKRQIKRNQSYRIHATDGTSISYGVSGYGSFYIHGIGRAGKKYDVYIKNGQIFENGKLIRNSHWADWAAKEIMQRQSKPIPVKIEKSEKIKQPKDNAKSSLSYASVLLPLAAYASIALYTGVYLSAFALLAASICCFGTYFVIQNRYNNIQRVMKEHKQDKSTEKDDIVELGRNASKSYLSYFASFVKPSAYNDDFYLGWGLEVKEKQRNKM